MDIVQAYLLIGLTWVGVRNFIRRDEEEIYTLSPERFAGYLVVGMPIYGRVFGWW